MVFLWLLSFGGMVLFAGETPSIHIFYTGNISGALTDCHCGGKVVGGITRLATQIKLEKQHHPLALIVDAGDFLNSYSLPDANLDVLRAMAALPYNVLVPGDQEFVEGKSFIARIFDTYKLTPPIYSNNLSASGVLGSESQPHVYTIQGIHLAILSITSPQSFEFIDARSIKIISPFRILNELKTKVLARSDFQLLLFHGSFTEAIEIVKRNPWLDVVIEAHEQRLFFDRLKNTYIAEAGTAGEYLGHMTLKIMGNQLVAKNEFIPITANIQEDGELIRLLNLKQ